MLFTSPSFLFIFLPIVLFLYASTPNHLKKYAMLGFSIVFYAFLNIREPLVTVLLFVCLIYTYVAGREIRSGGKRSVLAFFVLLEIFAFFMYRIFWVNLSDTGETFFFPGTSFFLLASVSYMYDVYRKDTDAGDSFVDMALYISFFPVVIAGPIIKYKDFVLMMDKRNFNVERFSSGVMLFCLGFIKKVVVAATLTETLSSFFGLVSPSVSIYSSLFGALIFFLKVLFEFWGYSDMAIGIASMFGYTIRDNFNNCIAACSVGDFFERFYISLRAWLHDYVYKPLRERSKRGGYVFPVVVSCIFGALWIKSDMVMIAAGLFVAICVCIEKRFSLNALFRKRSFLRYIFGLFTILFMSILFFLLRAGDFSDILDYVKNISLVEDVVYTYYIYTTVLNTKFLFVVFVIFAVFFRPAYEAFIRPKLGEKTLSVYSLVHNLLVLAVFLFSIVYFLPQHPEYFSVAFDFIAF